MRRPLRRGHVRLTPNSVLNHSACMPAGRRRRERARASMALGAGRPRAGGVCFLCLRHTGPR